MDRVLAAAADYAAAPGVEVTAQRRAVLYAAGDGGLKPCGTRAAYVRHRRRGEPVDEACLAANNQATQSRQRAARQRAGAA